MKRTGNLFEQIVERDNLRLAFHKALRGKRDRRDAQQFARRLDAEPGGDGGAARGRHLSPGPLSAVHRPRPQGTHHHGACFAERVLHHAVMNVCEPIFDRWLIDDTFACRTGRGRTRRLAAGSILRPALSVFPEARHPEILRQHPARPAAGTPGPALQGSTAAGAAGRHRRRLPGFAGPRLADRQPDLAALCQFLPGRAGPLGQGGTADHGLRPLHGRHGPVERFTLVSRLGPDGRRCLSAQSWGWS